MKVEQLLEKRRAQWNRLEELCGGVRSRSMIARNPQWAIELSELHRSACTDLALAQSYKLPPQTVEYLHGLVGRAHNQLYRSQKYQVHLWMHYVMHVAPRQIYADRCVQLCSILFFGLFFLSAAFAWDDKRFPEYANAVLGEEQMEGLEESFSEGFAGGRNYSEYMRAAAGYIYNNTGIGLKCFALGPLVVPGLFTLAYNAVILGASFGYMARADVASGENFFEFVTAHGPFELTAIVLAAAAGLRLGIGLLATGGMRRVASLQIHAIKALPVITASAILFFLAAFTEGLLSPSPAPYPIKAFWAAASSTAMMFYFVVLGYPRGDD